MFKNSSLTRSGETFTNRLESALICLDVPGSTRNLSCPARRMARSNRPGSSRKTPGFRARMVLVARSTLPHNWSITASVDGQSAIGTAMALTEKSRRPKSSSINPMNPLISTFHGGSPDSELPEQAILITPCAGLSGTTVPDNL